MIFPCCGFTFVLYFLHTSAAAFRVPLWHRTLLPLQKVEKAQVSASKDILLETKLSSQEIIREPRIPSKLLARGGGNQTPKHYSRFLSDGEEEEEGDDPPDLDGNKFTYLIL